MKAGQKKGTDLFYAVRKAEKEVKSAVDLCSTVQAGN